MIVVGCVEAVALVAVVVVTLLLAREERREIARERAQLLNRIQRPEVLPVEAAPQYILPEPEEDFSELVGTITYEAEHESA